MIKIYLFISSLLIISGCSGFSEKTKVQATGIAEEYAMKHLDNPSKEISGNGVILIGDDHKRFMIDTSLILTGLIDEDDQIDALATVISFNEGMLDLIEHLVIISVDHKMMMQRSIESDMRILSIEDRIITAEVPTHPRNSPLFNCPECREVVKYKYIDGELVRTD